MVHKGPVGQVEGSPEGVEVDTWFRPHHPYDFPPVLVIEKTGPVVDAKRVTRAHQLMIISSEVIITRTLVRGKGEKGGIAVQGRNTQGVRLMRMRGEDKVVAIACFEHSASIAD